MTTSRLRVALLLDEMFPPSIAVELRRLGNDVIAVAAEPELRSLTDSELYVYAAAGRRRIVTENVKDYRVLLMRDADVAGPGLLFTSVRTFPRSWRAPGSLIAALEGWLTQPGVAERPPEEWLLPADQAGETMLP